MKSTVYFINLRATHKENLLKKIGRLLQTVGIQTIVKKRDFVAIKLHFGEKGNTAFISPLFIRKIVEIIKSIGGVPFLTDCNTLYAGSRSDAPHHHITAVQNGFAYSVIDAPIIIADGLRGQTEIGVTINQKRFHKVYIGSEIVNSDFLLSTAHFKGHKLTGFGGTIKNLGMGCASKKGKLAQHSVVAPKVKRKKCVGCGDCAMHCPQNAISLIEQKAIIDSTKCSGCGKCIIICPNNAVQIQWNQDIRAFMENMVEYTMGVLKNKTNKALFLNFITNISPACDCLSYNDFPIVGDIGITASQDPVAIDQASVDLVNKEQALSASCLDTNKKPGEDKFRGLYPEVDWNIQLDYAEKIGLGNRDYELNII